MQASKYRSTLEQRKKTQTAVVRRKSSRKDTANRILETATRLFASQGYDGTSTKEICETAGANIAAIHYHFKSKENLYRHIIEQFATERLEAARNILQVPSNADDLKVRLEIFLSQAVEALLNQPDVAILIQRGIEIFDSKSEAVFRNTILKLFQQLVEFLNKAKDHGLLAADIDPFIAAGFLRNQFLYQTRFDRMMKKYYGYSLKAEQYRAQWVRQTVRLLLNGAAAK